MEFRDGSPCVICRGRVSSLSALAAAPLLERLRAAMDRPRTTAIWMLLLIQSGVGVLGGGQDKVWRRSTSWRNGDNWLGGRPPCAGERAVLSKIVVGLPQGSTVVREVAFHPVGGGLVLPTRGELVITGVSTDPLCPRKDAVFERSYALPWMDPGNWRLHGADFSAAVPHTERIPCMADRVVFPQGDSFYVDLPAVKSPVAALSINGEDLSDGEWTSFLRSERGRAQFVNPWRFYGGRFPVSVAGNVCEESLCHCHEEAAVVEALVCEVASLSCPYAPCVQPIQPRGHCCPLCGSSLTISHGATTSQPILNALERNLPPGVEMHASLGEWDDVHVVLVDSGGGYDGLSSDAGETMTEALRKDSRLQIHSVSLTTAGPAIKMSFATSFFGGALGTLSLVLVVLGMFYIFVYSHYTFPALKQETPPFVRFENVAAEAEEDARVKMVSPPPQPPPAASVAIRQSFHNPMYGQAGLEGRRAATRENPTYQELQHRQEVEDLEEVDIETSSS